MILLIDNYDSFTYNLVHFLGELGAKSEVFRNDQISAEEVIERDPDAIVLSPGPCTPNEAGICLDLVRLAAGRIPLLGVCLGHQSIGQAFGGAIIRAQSIMHGKLSSISHTGAGVFSGITNPFEATRYHSLVVDADSLPDCFDVTAKTEDGTIMGVQHKEYCIHGVQFHPESIKSQHGHDILRNFLTIAADG